MQLTCPICKSEQFTLVEPVNNYTIVECLECRLIYSHPMKAGDLSFYCHHHVYRHPTEQAALQNLEAIKNKHTERFLERIGVGSRTLDIGCGYGSFVSFSQSMGMDSYGVDFNEDQVRIGRSVFGLAERLIVGRIEDVVNLTMSSSFDLISLFEVIEHVEDPKKLLADAHRLLNRGGVLVLSCPNEDRWQPFGRIFVDYPPHHLTRWRPIVLEALLLSIGFKNVELEVDYNLRDIFWTYYVNKSALTTGANYSTDQDSLNSYGSNYYRAIRELKLALFVIVGFLCGPINFLLRKLRIGTMGMRIIATK